MKAALLPFIVAGNLLLCGCPFQANQSISDVQQPVDMSLVGKWLPLEGSLTKEEEAEDDHLWIADFNGKEYYVEWNWVRADDTPVRLRMRAFSSAFLGDNYMNLQSLEDAEESAKDRAYAFAKYQTTPRGLLVIQVVRIQPKPTEAADAHSEDHVPVLPGGTTLYENRDELLKFLKQRSEQEDYLKVMFYREYTSEKYTHYHENGTKKLEGYWNDGEKHGIWTEWDDAGRIVSKKIYVGGVVAKDLLSQETKGQTVQP